MPDAQFVDECAFAIPRKIGGEIGERHAFVRERSNSSVPDDVRPKLLSAEIHRTGDFDQRRRIALRLFERFPESECSTKWFQIETPLNQEFRSVAFPIPMATAAEN